jgi:soluble lytic murein transglycosylase-like protein
MLDLLFLVVASLESGFRASATSHKRARGLLQITPIAEKHVLMFPGNRWVPLAIRMDINRLYDPQYNVNLGYRYLRYCWEYTGRDIARTAALYNGGFKQLHRYRHQSAAEPMASETREYVKKVLHLYSKCNSIHSASR